MVVNLVHQKEIQRVVLKVPQREVHLVHLKVTKMAGWMVAHLALLMAFNLVV